MTTMTQASNVPGTVVQFQLSVAGFRTEEKSHQAEEGGPKQSMGLANRERAT